MSDRASERILARLRELHPKRIDLSLDRIERLLARLDHPQRRLAPVVHIAGTNGKGSTLAMLDAMLTSAGHRVHRYISPHLVRFNERILLHGREIDDARLAAILEICERANAGAPITFFEITTAAALVAFAESPADFILLETGLGGRLDATNLVERPALVLFSPISMDHQDFLGHTIESIAGEKAGIIKTGVPTLIGPQLPAVLAVLERRAAELGAPTSLMGRDFWIDGRPHHGLVFRTTGERLELPTPALQGVHQVENAGVAIAAATELGVPREAIAAGLAKARWAGRLQRLTHGPLPGLLRLGDELWLDGGHNPAAGRAIAESLPAIARGRDVHLVIGMLANKDLIQFAEPLARLAASVTAVPVPDEPAGRDPTQSAALLNLATIPARPAADVAEAMAMLDRRGGGIVVLITGSLYLAGHVMRENS